MANTPKILSKEEIIGLLVDSYLAKSEVTNDLSQGSVILSILEAAGEVGFKISSDVITMLDSIALDRARGDALKRIAVSKEVPIYSASQSSGNVNITDTSFTKIQNEVYAGRPAPVAGSAFIFVSDASKFPEQGAIYIGRGTNSVEGPLYYGGTTRLDPDDGVTPVSGIVQKGSGSHYMIVLDTTSETTKFHNLGETVIVAQGGDRLIPAGTTVQTSQSVAQESIKFTVSQSSRILDGETTITNVPVIATESGTKGNVSRGSIREAAGVAFSASVTNPLPFTNAIDDDSDEVLRERIKRYEQSKARGTEIAIKEAAINVTAPDEFKQVISANIKRTTGREQFLVIDDGNGYEPIDEGVGLEQIIDSALGGESEAQLENTMIERASVKTLIQSPFDVVDGDTLTVDIKGVGTFSHTFNEAFRVYRQATAYEVVSSINSNYNLPFVARTVEGGTRVVITPKEAQNIQVLSGGANNGFKFPTNTVYTARLYKNDRAVYQEGKSAFVETVSQANWGDMQSGYLFVYSVDSTPTVSVTITDADFQKYGPTLVVNKATDLTYWAQVLNDKLAGVTVTVVDDKLRLASNLGSSNRASIDINTTNTGYIGAAMFGNNTTVFDSGLSSDYSLNRKTGQIEWATPFDQGDTATAGSQFTRAKFETTDLPQALSLGADKLYIWLAVDGDAEQIAHRAFLPTITIVANPAGYKTDTAQINSGNTDGNFSDVAVGDYLIAWKNSGETDLADENIGIFRIHDVDTDGNYVVVNNPDAVSQGPLGLVAASRLTFVRSTTPVQVVELDPTTVTTPAILRDEINSQTVGLNAFLVGSKVRVESNSLEEGLSQILVAAFTDNSIILGIEAGLYESVSSHNGFSASDSDLSYGMPTFKLLKSYNTTVSQAIADNDLYRLNSGNQNEIIQWTNWHTGVSVSENGQITSYLYGSQNYNAFEQILKYDNTNSEIDVVRKGLTYRGNYNSTVAPEEFDLDGGYYADEPFILRQGLMFDTTDKLSFIIDQDDVVNSFITPVARKVEVKAGIVTDTQFDLTDDESNLDLNSPSTFRDFDFAHFKFWTQPKLSLNGMDFKYLVFGPSGSSHGVSVNFPDAPETDFSHQIIEGGVSAIEFQLSSGAAEDNDSDETTTWITEVVSTIGNTEYVKYTHKTGTAPTLNVNPLSVANISGGSSLLSANTGKYKITDNVLYPPTVDTFTIERLAGGAITDAPVIDSIVYPAVAGVPFPSGGSVDVTVSTGHNLNIGDVFGIYDPDVVEYQQSYTVTAIPSSTVVRAKATGINGGRIKSIKRVYLSSASIPDWDAGETYYPNDIVEDAVTPNIFYISVAVSFADDPSVASGSWVEIPNTSDHVVIVETVNPHNLLDGNSVKISDIVSPANINGTFNVFTSENATDFTYLQNFGGDNSVPYTLTSNGRADQQATIFGNMSKGLKFDDALQFYPVSATKQDLLDYVDAELSEYLEVEVDNPTDPLTKTQELNTDSGSITIYPVYGTKYRYIDLPNPPAFTKGSSIVFDIAAPATDLESDIDEQVLQVLEIDGSTIKVVVQRQAHTDDVEVTVNADYTAIQNVYGFSNGESFVLANDLSDSPSSPQFTLKAPIEGLAAGDKAYMIATNGENLSRLLARLANSGLSNVSEVVSSSMESSLQVKTDTFGSDGGVQMAGGRANIHASSVVGSGQLRNSVYGFDVLKDLRIGFVPTSFIEASNTSVQRKTTNIDSTTVIGINGPTKVVTIDSGAGSFQTPRNIDFDGENMVIEKHSKYAAYILTGSTPSNWENLRAGDWVRITDKSKVASILNYSVTGGVATVNFASAHSFNVGSTVSVNNSISITAQNIDGTYMVTNTTATSIEFSIVSSDFGLVSPIGSGTVTSQVKLLSFNQGIFQVVKTYGNAFWVENENAVEQYVEGLNLNSIRFYDYDSIMPNDVVTISTDVLGVNNIGTYKVAEWDDTNSIPSPTKIKLIDTQGKVTTQAPTVLGLESSQFAIFEASPLKLLRQITSVGPSSSGADFAFIGVEEDYLTDRISAAFGGGIRALGKLSMDESTRLGLDAYRYYTGLIAELYRVIYGDPNDPSYNGVRAAGADIDIIPPLVRRISVTLSVRIKTGVPPTEMIDAIKSAASGYVNSLGVGDQVSISALTSAVQDVEGVIASVVTSTSPSSDQGIITVLQEEVPKVIDPDLDIVVNIVGG